MADDEIDAIFGGAFAAHNIQQFAPHVLHNTSLNTIHTQHLEDHHQQQQQIPHQPAAVIPTLSHRTTIAKIVQYNAAVQLSAASETTYKQTQSHHPQHSLPQGLPLRRWTAPPPFWIPKQHDPLQTAYIGGDCNSNGT